MLAAFWSGLGSEFAKQWAARVLTPAFVFWGGGLSAVWWHEHASGVEARGWVEELTASAQEVEDLPVFTLGLVVVVALVLLVGSALALERLTLPALRALEGYWMHPRWLRDELVRRRRDRYRQWTRRVEDLNTRQWKGLLDEAEFAELLDLEGSVDKMREAGRVEPPVDPKRLDELRTRRAQGFDAADLAELVRARRYIWGAPDDDAMGMPTRLGDLLRAAERRPLLKYGLDGVVCWTALWLVLPTEAKTELVQARAAVDNATRTTLWGALFVVWTPWAEWAVLVALAVPLLAYYVSLLPAARLFGDLTVSAFDLYRFDLYGRLHLSPPSSPWDERQRLGPEVTNYLKGGIFGSDVSYVDPSGPAPGAAHPGPA